MLVSQPESDQFDLAVLGRGLPARAEALIAQAGSLRDEPMSAERLLWEAQALAVGHPATLIALYRFYFYGHRLKEARDVALKSMHAARSALAQRDGTGSLGLTFTDDQTRFDASVRFYLFSLKGYAYLSLRLGDLQSAREALAELKALDPQDRVGGAVLSVVLARADRGDDDDSPLDVDDSARADGRLPHRGWGNL